MIISEIENRHKLVDADQRFTDKICHHDRGMLLDFIKTMLYEIERKSQHYALDEQSMTDAAKLVREARIMSEVVDWAGSNMINKLADTIERLTAPPAGDMVMVPREKLEEIRDSLPLRSQTGEFEPHVAHARRLRQMAHEILSAAPPAKAVECCSSCGQAINTRHFDGCAYGGMTNPYVTEFQCVRINPQEEGK